MLFAPEVCGIYTIRHIATGRCYVGQSKDIRIRAKRHRYDLIKNKHRSRYFQNAWNKHGEDAFELCVLEIISPDPDVMITKSTLTIAEQRWMDALKPVFNNAPAAGSNIGMKFSPEHCAKISASKMGHKHSEEACRNIGAGKKGRKLGPEHISKISKAMIGRKRTKEHQDKLTAALTGLKRSPEACAKMSVSHIGKPSARAGCILSEETRAKISLSKTGSKLSNETRARMSVARRGVSLSEEHRVKLRAAWVVRKAKNAIGQLELL